MRSDEAVPLFIDDHGDPIARTPSRHERGAPVGKMADGVATVC
jgi:hypothetical protein